MRQFMRLFSIGFASFIALISSVCSALTFQPSARESLAIDRLVEPVTDIPAERSRVLAFIGNARTHDFFTAGHFDPGRVAA